MPRAVLCFPDNRALRVPMITAGDLVIVFSEQDARLATIANYGLALGSYSERPSHQLIYVPTTDSYCWATDNTLLKCFGDIRKYRFAVIEFEHFSENRCFGTYQRNGGQKNQFEFTHNDENCFTFEFIGKLNDTQFGLADVCLSVRVPTYASLTSAGCANILRQILRLDFARIIDVLEIE